MKDNTIKVKEIIEKSGLEVNDEQIEKLTGYFEKENYYEFNRLIIKFGIPDAIEILDIEEILKAGPDSFGKANRDINTGLNEYIKILDKNKNSINESNTECRANLNPNDSIDLKKSIKNLKGYITFYSQCVENYNKGKKICIRMQDPKSWHKESLFVAQEKSLCHLILKMLV